MPELRRLPPGETVYLFTTTPTHVAFEEYDVAAQIAPSRHYWVIDGQLRTFSSPHRYVWPSELDLMARIAGMRLRQRWSTWSRDPFDGESRSHISVWQKPPEVSGGSPSRPPPDRAVTGVDAAPRSSPTRSRRGSASPAPG